MRKAELADRRAIVQAIANSAALGTFAVAIGDVGFDEAVALCGTRAFSERLRGKWEELGHRPEQMPSAQEIERLILGVRIDRVQKILAMNKKPPRPLTEFGCTAAEAQAALLVCERFGASSLPAADNSRMSALRAI